VCNTGHATIELRISENGRVAIVFTEVEISLFRSGYLMFFIIVCHEQTTMWTTDGIAG
jgi:hypothetical protein